MNLNAPVSTLASMKWLFIVLFVGLVPVAGRAGEPPQLVHRKGTAFTTDVVLTIPEGTIESAALDAAFKLVLDEFFRIDALFSEWRAQTPISRLNAAAGKPVALPPEVARVLRIGVTIAKLTHGAFDPTFKTYAGVWALKATDFRPPSAEQLAPLRRAAGYQQIHFQGDVARLGHRETRIGMGGIAKGHAVDRAVKLLKKQGLKTFCLRVGGELYCAGEKAPGLPWTVGIQDPRDPSKLVGSLPLRDAAFTTSGDYERFAMVGGVRYHHILDMATGRPARRSRSATVLSRSPTEADAFSTAFFVMGPAAALELVETMPGAEAAFVDAQGKLRLSSGLKTVFKVTKD